MRVQLLAQPIIRETGADAWLEWVVARELAPAIADVAAELQATRIVVGDRWNGRRPVWRRRWSLPAHLQRLAPCPVQICDTSTPEVVAERVSSGVSS